MITIAVVTLGRIVLEVWLGVAGVGQALALTPADVLRGHVWQLFTYAFIAVEPFDLIFTLLVLWMFGGVLERRLGPRGFLFFYLGVAVGAALCTVGAGLAIDAARFRPYTGTGPLMGAMVAAYALTFPDSVILFSFIIPMKGRTLLAVDAAVIALLILFTGTAVPFVPHVAALAMGAAVGAGRQGPRRLWLRLRAFWIERKLSRSHLRVVPGQNASEEEEREKRGPWLH
jgi:membrane associated rhomboid family serine protease